MFKEVMPQERMFIEKMRGIDMAEVQTVQTGVQRTGPDRWPQYLCAEEFEPC